MGGGASHVKAECGHHVEVLGAWIGSAGPDATEVPPLFPKGNRLDLSVSPPFVSPHWSESMLQATTRVRMSTPKHRARLHVTKAVSGLGCVNASVRTSWTMQSPARGVSKMIVSAS